MRKCIFTLIKIGLIILVLSGIFLCLIPINSNTIAHIVLAPVEKKFQKKVEFDASHIWLPANISLEGALIIDENGRLYYIKRVDINYNLLDLLFKKKKVFFDLKEIKLYQSVGLLDSVADMLIISKMADVEFEEIKGTLVLHRNSIFIEHLYAHNDKMRIKGNGRIDNNGSLDCKIDFSFSKDVTDMVPDAVKEALLRDEDKGWMGIVLKAKGNYKKPSLNITGETLKLNIMEGLLGN